MFRHITVMFVATMVLTVFLSTHYSFAKKVECKDGYDAMKWDANNHGVNHPSSKEFKMLAEKGSLCELSKCVDVEECTNHDAVDWQEFKSSPAYELSSGEQKECLTHAHNGGNGQDGLEGYEVLACGLGEGYD